jgi:hypothetical protein
MPTGAQVWQEYRRRRDELNPRSQGQPFAYTDVVHEKYSRYFTTLAAAEAEIAEVSSYDDHVSVVGPTPIGPWRAQWWRRFERGFRIDVEERRKWAGSGGGGGKSISFHKSRIALDSHHLQDVLRRYQVTPGEWLCMWEAEHETWPEGYGAHAADRAQRWLDLSISIADCEAGFESCLQQSWLRISNDESMREVHSLLAADPVFQPVPRIVEQFVGFVDFTPTGATVYRATSAEIFGENREAALCVSLQTYREEHRYSESKSGFQEVFQEIAQHGEHILAMQIVPLGPWCVYWWEQFPAGFRLEVQIGSDLAKPPVRA